MTNQKMLDNIKDSLGNRSSGRIGSRTVDAVVLDAMNIAIPMCVLESQPDYYNRTCHIDLIVGTREYALPVIDDDSETIRIKDIYGQRCWRSNGTEVVMKHVNYAEFLRKVPDFELEVTGTPHLYSLWGKANKLYLDYLPSEALTLTLFVESFPAVITNADLNLAMPLDDQWNLAVEAMGTAYCFLKMQQHEMYALWTDLYEKQKPSIQRMENQKHGANQSVSSSGGGACVSDPVLNPFVRTWN